MVIFLQRLIRQSPECKLYLCHQLPKINMTLYYSVISVTPPPRRIVPPGLELLKVNNTKVLFHICLECQKKIMEVYNGWNGTVSPANTRHRPPLPPVARSCMHTITHKTRREMKLVVLHESKQPPPLLRALPAARPPLRDCATFQQR